MFSDYHNNSFELGEVLIFVSILEISAAHANVTPLLEVCSSGSTAAPASLGKFPGCVQVTLLYKYESVLVASFDMPRGGLPQILLEGACINYFAAFSHP